MLELGQGGANAANDLVKDTTEASFAADVIDGSAEIPVIVDFWAPWCGPCKTLGPMLEAAVKAAKGKVRMVKVDIDREQRLAAALAQQGLPLQSIPVVVAFHEGRPVDMFQGAVPRSRIDDFVARAAALAGGGGLDDALAAAEAMLAEGAAVDAAQVFAGVLGEDPENAAALGGLARAHLALGDADKAEGVVNAAPEAIAAAPELQAVRARIALARQAANAGPHSELSRMISDDPGNSQARFDYAQALYAAGETEAAIDQLLELFRRAPDWNDGAAKAQLFTIFEALTPQDPIALNGRRKLSSLIFA